MTMNRVWTCWRVWAALGLAFAVTAACAARDVRMDHDNLSALKDGPPIKRARHAPPAFFVSNPPNSAVDSLFGVSGGALIIPGRSAGDAPLEEEYALDDPAAAVGDEVFEALAFELGVQRDQSERVVLSDDRVESVTRVAGTEGWLLDVTTLRWGLAHNTKFPMHYHVQLEASGRLVDLSRQRVAWRATCDGSEDKVAKGTLLTELRANDGLELRERLDAATKRCAEELVAHLFAGVR